MGRKQIDEMREQMEKEGLDMYLVPTDDFHGSEYVGDYFKCREYLSGFTGSAGTLVIAQSEAALFTDGRYFLQAQEELKNSGIQLMKSGNEGVPTVTEYIENMMPKGGKLGFDGRTVSVKLANKLEKAMKAKKAEIIFNIDLVDKIWKKRPGLSHEGVMLLDEIYTGATRAMKLERLREYMKENKADYFLDSALDDIAWLLNIRGADIAYNPVLLSYLIVKKDEAILFAEKSAFENTQSPKCGIKYDGENVIKALRQDGIKIKPYNSVYGYLLELPGKSRIITDPQLINYSLRKNIAAGVKVLEKDDPVQQWKAVKNLVEISNERNAHIKDAVAVIKFLHWLKVNVGKQKITELSAAEKLESYRRGGEGYTGQSFAPIFGYAAHGAIVHYEATQETNVELKPKSFVLIDTGGQYLEGTTDITRTVPLGKLTEEEKRDYTLVLRGNLNLLNAKFMYGMRGVGLDYIARKPLWENGLDYNHGTGHGVGYFLNVHENPVGFRYKIRESINESPIFEEGMITSDEPGVYITGRFGVRLENMIVCLRDYKNEYGQFMKFEPLTLVPFDLSAIDLSLLTITEKKYLNEYHSLVYEKISQYLSKSDREWLKNETRAV